LSQGGDQVLNLFSSRQKRKEISTDVLIYDELPKPFRVQVVHIWGDAIGRWDEEMHRYGGGWGPNLTWDEIYRLYIREKGFFHLDANARNPQMQVLTYFLQAEVDDGFDLIDLVFRHALRVRDSVNSFWINECGVKDPNECIRELN